MLHVCAKNASARAVVYAVVRVRKCASGEGLNSRRMCVHKCARARPALMRSNALTFASGEGLNSQSMCVHRCKRARMYVRVSCTYCFFSLFALNPAIERCNSCELQNAPR